ncbi:TonB-dependent receptor [Aliikangiella maris]|uniref:TonB-dependent receptor n=2 Tax=Aliikangiella maris TaxID=3162458 RepID=A0ABV2BR31_9GAMM
MNKKQFKQKFKLTLAAMAVSTLLAVPLGVQASSNNTGSIYGEAETGISITYKSKATGAKRTVVVGKDGRFNFKDVPPGRYVVTTSDGKTREIIVKIGTGSAVDFMDSQENVVRVVGTRVSSIDMSSSESTMVFTDEQISLLPVARNLVDVAMLTPGTVQGDDDFGNLPSFGGASVAENGYYIDGFDVTNIRTFLNYANLPFDAISQTQVKSGGYGAEFGRSLGGVTNIVTKSGSNEWEVSAAVYYTPDSLRADRKDVVDKGSINGAFSVYDSDDYNSRLAYNVSIGGPIIQDELFIFANIEGRKNTNDWYYTSTSTHQEITSPNALIKLDWFVTDNHQLSMTYIQNKTDEEKTDYKNPVGEINTGIHGEEIASYTEENGGDIKIINYIGHLTDDFSVKVMYGELSNKEDNENPRVFPGGECPLAWDTSGDLTWTDRVYIGCWNQSNDFITDPNFRSDGDERTALKFDFDWTIGDHTIRFGYDSQEFISYSPGVTYSGERYYRYISGNDANGGVVNGVDVGVGTLTVRERTYATQSGNFKVDNTAFYIEDSWMFNDDLMLYLGIRNETFTNYAANNEVFVEADDLIAPRLGFSWDLMGDGTQKLFASVGRYFIPIASNTNIRATRTETYTQKYFYTDGFDVATGEPIGLGAQFGSEIIDIQVPDPRVIAVSDLEPMHQDELIIGYQRELGENWTGGAKLIYKTVRDGMDDFCAHDGFYNWAQDNGFTNFYPGTMSGCLIVNPGKDLSLFIDLEHDGNLTHVTVPNEYFQLPEYKRTYKGLEFTAERTFNDDFFVNVSYLLSYSKGNVEGYVNSTLGQEDAGATQDFDHYRYQEGSDGYLPNDRRHQFKAYGAYKLTDEVTLTGRISASSGSPTSCNGYIPLEGLIGEPGTEHAGDTSFDYANFQRYSASSFYCKDENGVSQLSKRGAYGETDWLYTLDMGINYRPEAVEGLTLQVDVFNPFNFDTVTEVNQQKDLARDNNEVNPNFLSPTGFQAPRRVDFTIRYQFF